MFLYTRNGMQVSYVRDDSHKYSLVFRVNNPKPKFSLFQHVVYNTNIEKTITKSSSINTSKIVKSRGLEILR